MRRPIWAALTAFAVAGQPAAAETFYLSAPGLCDASDGELELADVIYLTEHGIDSHYFGCEWPVSDGRAILRAEHSVTTRAQCSNGTGSWEAAFEVVPQDDGSIQVFQDSGGISPVRFFRCP